MPDPRRFDERLKIVSPCSEDWSAMRGNDRVRLCSHCDLSVHDASRMTRKEVRALVRASKGRLCMRIERDPLGRIRTLDAPTLVPLSRRASRLAAGAMTVALAAAAAEPVAPAFGAQEPAAAAAASADAKPSGGGAVFGTVADAAGAAVPGATVTVRADSGIVVGRCVSGADGAYRVAIPEGVYTVTFVASGFSTYVVPDVTVPSAPTSIDAALEVGTFDETVTVTESGSYGGGEAGAIATTPAAYELVWHTDEREAAGEEVARAEPPLVDADDLERAIRAARDVDERDVFGDTALMYFTGDLDTAKLLIERGANPNATDRFGATPLMRAALYDDEEAVRLLLRAGASVDARDLAGLTALMVASAGGNATVVKALIAAGADVGAVDARGETPLSYARKERERAVAKILRAAGAAR